jgi:hypothetical protein
MVTMFYPLLTRENYCAFKRFVADLPETFDKWEFEIGQHKRKESGAWESGFEAKDVPIDLAEFKRYCETNNEKPTRSVLEQYARENRRQI